MKTLLVAFSVLALSTTAFATGFSDRALYIGVGQWQMVGGPSGVANMTWEACGNMTGGRSAVDMVGLAAFDGLYKFTPARTLEAGEVRVNPYAPTVGQPSNPAVTDIFWLVDNNTESNFIQTGGQFATENSYFNFVVQQGVINEETGFLEGDKLIRNGKLLLADGTVIFYNSVATKQDHITSTCDRL